MKNNPHTHTNTRLASVLFAALALALALIVGGAAPAGASCLGPPSVDTSLRDADLAFVGTAVDVTNNGRWATFSVEEVWKGDPGGQVVEVRGGPGGQAATSVDRTYVSGTRYLVFARDPGAHGLSRAWGDDGRWEDGACSATQPYTADLDRFRPQAASATGGGVSDNPPVPRSQDGGVTDNPPVPAPQDGGVTDNPPVPAPQDGGVTDNPPVPRSQPGDQRTWPSVPVAAGVGIAALAVVALGAAAAVGRVGPRQA